MQNMKSTAFIALGSNLGDSREVIRQAIKNLRALSTTDLRVSSLWETIPVDCPPGSPNFLNAVVALQLLPWLTPESLLQALQSLEKAAGRQPKKVMNEARVLDLDLIAFNNETRHTPSLILPHPRAHERRFVLEPLSEIAPDFLLLDQSKTVAQLLQALPFDPQMKNAGQI